MFSSWICSLDIKTDVGWRATADPKSHRAPSRQQAHSCRLRPITPNTVQLECFRCTDWVLPVLYLYGSSDIIFLTGAQCKDRCSEAILQVLQMQSFVSDCSFGITSHRIHRMDTVLLTQIHYIITHKGESCNTASISHFQIKSICVSNPIRPSVHVTVHESIYGV